jgi:hypothetical protein
LAKGGAPGAPAGKGKKGNNEFWANLRHYLPCQGGDLTIASGVKNFGQWKFPGNPTNLDTADWTPQMANATPVLAFGPLDGSTETILLQTPTTGAEAWTHFTMGAWVRAGDFAVNRYIISKEYQGSLRTDQTTGLPSIIIRTGGAPTITATGTTAIPTTGTLTFVVATFDKVNLKIYVNGKLEGSTAHTGDPDQPAVDIRIGSWPSAGFEWNGLIAEPFIMNRALNQGTIMRMYANWGSFVSDPGPELVSEGPEALPQEFDWGGVDIPITLGAWSFSQATGGTGGKLIGPGYQNQMSLIS